jgi:DNA-binding IclR family transcriptional regulator
MLALLDVFTPAAPVWSSEDLIRYSGMAASTCYRYLKVLHSSGFLARVANGSYVLGPRILELDHTMRQSDPVYILGTPVIEELRARTGHNALLSILYSDSVMCVQEALSQRAPAEIFRRGQKRPLVAGASAKVILAYLPLHQLRSVYAKHRTAIAATGLGADWVRFRAILREIRKAGFSLSLGEYNPGIVSISAPLFNRTNEVLGSVTLAAPVSQVSEAVFREFIPDVVEAAREVTARIASESRLVALAARAIG